jgi:hypothetical protein
MTLTAKASSAFLRRGSEPRPNKDKVKVKIKVKAKDGWISVEPRRAVVPLFPKV